MRQVQTDKYNVAWFKLAEFVARGEKERALGMYRLLMHSVDDKALALQLEGDLLQAFYDETAHERYAQAAEQYCRDERFVQAIALYEQLVSHQISANYLIKLGQLYHQVNNLAAMHNKLIECARYFITHQHAKKIESLCELVAELPNDLQTDWYKMVVVELSSHQVDSSMIHHYLDRAVSLLVTSDDSQMINSFVALLAVTDQSLVEYTKNRLQHV